MEHYDCAGSCSRVDLLPYTYVKFWPIDVCGGGGTNKQEKTKQNACCVTDFKINVLCKYAINHAICGFKTLTLSNINRTEVLQSRYRPSPLKNTVHFFEMMQSILLMISSASE